MSILTYKDLQDRVLRWIDEGTDTNITRALAKDAVNASHRRLLVGRQWPFMAWPRTETFTTVANQQTYSLHPFSNRVYHLFNVTARQYIPILPRREWPSTGVDRAKGVDPAGQTTAPYGLMLGPNWPCKAQPAAAGVISITSSDNSDSSQTVILWGLDSDGTPQTETITATGTTPAAGAISFQWLTNITKTGTWAGVLTITDSDANTLLTLPAAESGRLYPTVEFVEPPLPDRQFLYNFQRQPLNLNNDTDIPETPYPYSEIHVYDSLLDLTTYNTELGGKEQVLWKKRYDELFDGLVTAWDEEIVGAYPRFVRDLDDKGIWSRVAVYNP